MIWASEDKANKRVMLDSSNGTHTFDASLFTSIQPKQYINAWKHVTRAVQLIEIKF